jgi:hypothetical protein
MNVNKPASPSLRRPRVLWRIYAGFLDWRNTFWVWRDLRLLRQAMAQQDHTLRQREQDIRHWALMVTSLKRELRQCREEVHSLRSGVPHD